MVRVEVNQDLFGTGRLINPSDISLGGCGPVGKDADSHMLLFESHLHGCGSTAVMTEDSLIYNFTLVYTPQAFANAPIVRMNRAVIGIECYYLRFNNVSSSFLKPSWIPYTSTKIAEELLVFTLTLMTDDWKFERPSNVFFLGDILKIEASVQQYNHVPLRVFVDSCVATTIPDVSATPSYSFIENHGCLVDSLPTGSTSHFLPRSQDHQLQFQLESFQFTDANNTSVYITCLLIATAASSPTDEKHKACSYISNG
ncbi:zona pellucida sperm-binding protein 3-like [Denticeps clupeoides]|uniref:zona pellucida sperm-binding protein 3-like n=1 Tax=Denticeps clupeoides TaxID=299321 RepID=UPI0010A51818|nr:zona pellucida sperm-binding protein 3-like [Denticeps clupeoides]